MTPPDAAQALEPEVFFVVEVLLLGCWEEEGRLKTEDDARDHLAYRTGSSSVRRLVRCEVRARAASTGKP
jgi:hypothetical protein